MAISDRDPSTVVFVQKNSLFGSYVPCELVLSKKSSRIDDLVYVASPRSGSTTPLF